MICLTDPVEVFDILELHDEAGFDPAKNHAAVFQCNQHLAVLIFCCNGKLKGPRLYLFEQPWHSSEIRDLVTAELMAISGDDVFENARTLTIETLNTHFESLSASNFFFDAH